MSKPISDKMRALKNVFFVLLIWDFIGLVQAVIALIPTLKQLAGYGQIMLVVASVMVALAVAVLLFELLAKIFLVRSTAPEFSWPSGHKGYTTAAKFLLLFNLGAVFVGLLSAGGEGATLINQGYLYLRVLASVAEAVAVFIYLRTVKKVLKEKKESSQ